MTITLTREEAQQVLDALADAAGCVQENYQPGHMGHGWGKEIETLRARLSAPEPTLVLWNVKSNRLASPSDDRAQVFAIRKLEWQSLTDEEVKDIVWNLPYEPSQEHIRAIEAKLKEKNT
jgi:hypothetical protein